MTQKIKHYICEKDGRIKWQFRLILSAAILSIMLAESRFLYYHSPKDTKWLICIIYALTGYYCPGCGAGRACYCILHGQIYQAFRYNPLLVLLLPWIGAYLALCACQWLFTGRESISKGTRNDSVSLFTQEREAFSPGLPYSARRIRSSS